MGTQAYLAPELFESAPITPAADLWSLGVTLCHAAEGRGPFERATTGATLRAILIDDLPALTGPPPLAAAITGLLQRDPARRATTSQARACLQQATAQVVPQPPEPGPAPQPPPGSTWPPPHPVPAVDRQLTWQQARTSLSTSPPLAPRPPVPRAAGPGAPRRSRRLTILAAAALVVAAAVILPALIHGARPVSAHHHARPRASSPYPAAGSYPAVTLNDPEGYSANSFVMSAAFSPDDKTLAVGDGDDRTYLWDVATHRITATLRDPGTGPHPGVNSVAFSPDGQTLAVPEADGSTYLWDVATGQLTAKLTDTGGTDPEANSAAFSPDGQMLAAGDNDSITYLWNVATHRSITTLTEPAGSGGVISVAFSPDGQTLAVADGNGNCYLWDVASGQLTTTLTGSGVSSLGSVVFSRDGKTLATGDDDSIYLWKV
jgi:sugar lactone lactonase YvrE